MTDRYTDLRAALEAGPTPGARRVSGDGLRILDDAGGELLSRQPDGCSTLYTERGAQQRANVMLAAATDPATIRALLADYDRLREALEWTAAALQSACTMPEPIREAGDITIAGETRTIKQILDAADTALAQEGL